MFVQEIVNRYGSAVIAGYSGAVKLNTFAINAFMSLGGCLSSYTAQNLGAGKRERKMCIRDRNGTPEPYCENSINPKTGPPLNISDARSFAVLCPEDVYKRQI